MKQIHKGHFPGAQGIFLKPSQLRFYSYKIHEITADRGDAQPGKWPPNTKPKTETYLPTDFKHWRK